METPFDETVFGFDNNIQPRLTREGGVPGALSAAVAPTVEFSVNFTNAANGNDLLLEGFVAQANDVDGDNNVIQEGVRFYGADTIDVGSAVTSSSGTNARGAFLQGESSSTNANNGIGAEASNLAIANYNSGVTTFDFDYFFTTTGSVSSSSTALPRLNSLFLQTTSVTEVPFEFSPALGLVITGLGIGFHQFGKKRKNLKIEK